MSSCLEKYINFRAAPRALGLSLATLRGIKRSLVGLNDCRKPQARSGLPQMQRGYLNPRGMTRPITRYQITELGWLLSQIENACSGKQSKASHFLRQLRCLLDPVAA